MSRESLVYAFHDEMIYEFKRADQHTASHFGGPSRYEFSGQPFGPKPLHLIARLFSADLPVLARTFIHELPLIFGMHYDGCDLSYRIGSGHRIEVIYIRPAESLDDWPYLNFPPLLPYVPLKLEGAPRSESYDEFAQRFPNMPWPQPTELVVAVPSPATIGVSLWEAGDCVTIVFECNLEKTEVKAYAMAS